LRGKTAKPPTAGRVIKGRRNFAAPEIPTAVEAGFPAVIAQQVIGLFAPTETPTPIIERISAATRMAMAEKALSADAQRRRVRAAVRLDAGEVSAFPR
jgi:tripartite-type tricarboxylate transporter receptor subunit TctC